MLHVNAPTSHPRISQKSPNSARSSTNDHGTVIICGEGWDGVGRQAALGSGESVAGYFLMNLSTTWPLTLPQSWTWLSAAPQCEIPMCLPLGNLP